MSEANGASGKGPPDAGSVSRRVRVNVALKLTSEVVGKLLALVLTAALARGLGQAGFGVYVFGFTAGLMLAQVCDFGMQLFAAREVAGGRPDAPQLVGNLLLARGTLGAVGLGGLIAGAGLAGFDGEGRVAVCALAATAVVTSFGEFAFYVFRGRQEVRFEAGLSVLQRALGLIAALTALRMGWGTSGVAWGLLGAAAVSVAAAYGVLTRRFFRPDFTPDRTLLREAFRGILPIGTAIALSAVCFRADVMILKAFRGIEAVGIYGAGRRLMEPLALLPAALMAGVFPAYSALPFDDPRRPPLIRKTSLLLLSVSLPLAAFAAIFRGTILQLVYGPGYAAAAPAFVLFMITLTPMFLTYGFTHFLIALGLARLNALFFGVGLVVNLTANFVLVPSLGATGSALALLITEGVLMALCGGALLKVAR